MDRTGIMSTLAGIAGPRWIEVDTAALEHNVRQIRGLLGGGTGLMAVVKADAYGLGAVETARAAVAAGAVWLGVTTVEEGLELRRHGLTAPILVLAPPLEPEAPDVVRHGLTATVTDPDVAGYLAQAARALGKRARVHLKVETGLGRLGLEPPAAVALARAMAAWSGVDLDGVFTHLGAVGHNPGLVRRQAAAFAWTLAEMERAGVRPRLRHICNSAATLAHPDLHYDLVRVGNLLYAQAPRRDRDRLALRDPWQVRARILQVRQVPRGYVVGYAGGFRTRRPSTLAVIPLGYADGLGIVPSRLPRGLGDLIRTAGKLVLGAVGLYGGPETVEVRGRRVPLVGRVAMQLCVADVSAVPDVAAGDEVTVPALRRTNAGARLPRVYTREGVPYRVRTLAGEVALDGLVGDGGLAHG